MLLEFANSSASSSDFGKISEIFSLKLIILGIFSLVTLSKFVFDDNNSVFALIKSAFAPASEDSDWAKSVKVISPFWTLALSESTCLWNKFKFR